MQETIREQTLRYSKTRRRRTVWYRIVAALCSIVVFCTTYAMILPAITLDSSDGTYCGMEAHTHTDACYEIPGTPAVKELICEFATHTHAEACYTGGTLTCGYGMIVHQHNMYCYEGGELICELPEVTLQEAEASGEAYLAHNHTAACVHETPAVNPQNLLCTKTEHTHTEACFTAPLTALPKMALGAAPLGAAPTEESPTSGIEMSKQIKSTENGYELQLQTYVTGTVTKTTTYLPQDIVLVLDVSGSMDYYATVEEAAIDYTYSCVAGIYHVVQKNGDEYDVRRDTTTGGLLYNTSGVARGGFIGTSHKVEDYTWKPISELKNVDHYEVKKIYSLEIAASHFLEKIYQQSDKDNQHSVTIIQFADEYKSNKTNALKPATDSSIYGSGYTQVLLGRTKIGYNGDGYGNLYSMYNVINKLEAYGATYADYGMELAAGILDSSTVPAAQQCVVLFTDGGPNHYNGFDGSVANSVVATAGTLKAKGVTIYTVGCFNESDSKSTSVQNYMQAVSSNYPNAASKGSTSSSSWTATMGAQVETKYAQTDVSVSNMVSVFDYISSEILKAAIEIDETTVLHDKMTDYFEIRRDDMNKTDVKVYTCEYSASGWSSTLVDITDTVTVNVSKDYKTVNVLGFDFAENFVCTTPGYERGKKLVISIPIVYTGSGEATGVTNTNTDDSGVYVPVIDPETGEPEVDPDTGEIVLEPVEEYEHPAVQLPAVINLKLITQQYTGNGKFNFDGVNTADKVSYDGSSYVTVGLTDVLKLSGLSTAAKPFNFDMTANASGFNITLFSVVDADDSVTGNDTMTLTGHNIPEGYGVHVYKTVNNVTTELDVTRTGTDATFSFNPVGTQDIEVVIRPEKLKITASDANGNTNHQYHYKVTYTDVTGAAQTVEFDLKSGESKTIEDLRYNTVATIVESNCDQKAVEYRNADDTATLGNGETYSFTALGDTELIVKNTSMVVMPATGAVSDMILRGCLAAAITAVVMLGGGLLFNRKKERYCFS